MNQTIKKQKRPGSDHTYDFYHAGRDLLFQRVISGIVFPAEEPGFFVVLGEEAVLPGRAKPKIYWLDELEMQDLGGFVRACLDVSLEYKVQGIYGNPEKAELVFLSEFRKAASNKKMPTIHIAKAPRFNIPLSFHLNLLRENLKPESQQVFLSSNSCLPGALQGIPTVIGNITDKQCPGPAALAYAVATLLLRPYSAEGIESHEADGSYDVFNENR